MHRRAFIRGVASALFVPSVVEAQPSAKVYRIGYLGNFPLSGAPSSVRMWEAFTQALQQGGYVEGRNIVFEKRYAEGRNERLPALAADLVREDVDVIVVSAAGSGAGAVRDATKTIPIVMVGVTDPVGTGLIASLSHPGGNITGIVDFHAELDPKRLELLKTAAPKTMRVAVIGGQFGPPSTAIDPYRSELASVAQALSVRLSYIDLNNPDAFEKVTAAIMRDRPDALLVGSTPVNFRLRKEIADFAIAQRLPTVSAQREMAAAGILISYGADLASNFRTAGMLVGKILSGVKPADLAVEQPSKFEIVINMKTAKALDLTLPQSLLLRADQVIQ
jgi:putative ABC transport system substrate-binding protein